MITDRPKVLLFFVLAFAWAWSFWIPTALIANGWAAPAWLDALLTGPSNPGAWGPLIAAIAVSWLEGGRAGVRRLLRRGSIVRFGWRWYVVILLLFPVLVGGSLLVAVAAGSPMPELPALEQPLTIPVAFVFILLLGGPLQEEFGWRGYALDRLLRRRSALVSSLVVGVAWGLWHLPLFFTGAEAFYYQRPVWEMLVSTVLVAILFTWVYEGTGRSVFAALLFHTMFNLSHYVFPALESSQASRLLIAALALTVVAVLIGRGPERWLHEREPVPATPTAG